MPKFIYVGGYRWRDLLWRVIESDGDLQQLELILEKKKRKPDTHLVLYCDLSSQDVVSTTTKILEACGGKLFQMRIEETGLNSMIEFRKTWKYTDWKNLLYTARNFSRTPNLYVIFQTVIDVKTGEKIVNDTKRSKRVSKKGKISRSRKVEAKASTSSSGSESKSA